MTRETVFGKKTAMTSESANGKLAVATAMLIAIIYAVMEWLTPFQFDNIVFDAVYLEFSGGSSGFSLDAYMQYINHIRQEDNWRMANILAPASTLILNSKPIFSALCGLCVGQSAWLGARFASAGKRPGFGAVVAMWVAITLALPWRNNILTGDYALNYLFSMALALMALRLVALSLRRNSRATVAWAIALCVVVAVWHEGFALPLAAGIGLYAISQRLRVPARVWVYLLLTAGVCILWLLCSYQTTRSGAELASPAILESPVKAVAFNFTTVALCFSVLFCLLFSKLRIYLRKAMSQPVFIMLCGCALAGMLLSFAVRQSGRTALWPQMCSLIAMLTLWRPLWGRVVPARASRLLWGVLALLLTAQGVYACKYINLHRLEFTAIMEEAAHGGGTIYRDVLFPEDYPALTLGMAPRSTFIEPYTYSCIDRRYGPEKETAVVPEVLRNLPVAGRDTLCLSPLVERIDGSALIMADNEAADGRCGLGEICVTTSAGESVRRCFMIRFKGADGNFYRYIKPFGVAASEVLSVKFLS